MPEHLVAHFAYAIECRMSILVLVQRTIGVDILTSG